MKIIIDKIEKPLKVTKTKTHEDWNFGYDDYYDSDDEYYEEVDYKDIKKSLK